MRMKNFFLSRSKGAAGPKRRPSLIYLVVILLVAAFAALVSPTDNPIYLVPAALGLALYFISANAQSLFYRRKGRAKKKNE